MLENPNAWGQRVERGKIKFMIVGESLYSIENVTIELFLAADTKLHVSRLPTDPSLPPLPPPSLVCRVTRSNSRIVSPGRK